jgi:hypothetical protein
MFGSTLDVTNNGVFAMFTSAWAEPQASSDNANAAALDAVRRE